MNNIRLPLRSMGYLEMVESILFNHNRILVKDNRNKLRMVTQSCSPKLLGDREDFLSPGVQGQLTA